MARTNKNLLVAVSIAPDPRASLLLRAACRWELFEVGEMDLDEAFDGLIEPFMSIVPCACQRDIIEHLDRSHSPKWGRT